MRRSGAAVGLFLLAFAAGCSNPLGRQYQYEEQIYLSVDGSATVVVDASIPAFVALERRDVRSVDDSRRRSRAGARVVRGGGLPGRARRTALGAPRTSLRAGAHRGGTTFASSAPAGPLAWSRYQFERDDEAIHFVQDVGPPPAASREP